MIRRTVGLVLLALAVVACAGGQATQSTGPVVSPQAIQVPPSTGDSTGEEAAGQQTAANVAEATGETAALPSASETSSATAGPTPVPPTPDPTVLALAASFKFPRRGNETAPLTIYEFTDYL